MFGLDPGRGFVRAFRRSALHPRHRRVAILLLSAFVTLSAAAQTAPQVTPQITPQSQEAAPAQNQTPPPAQLGKTGVFFWDLPDRQITAMLAAPPRKEADRYARLRQYFTSFGCSGANLTELHNSGRHTILLCTLPGATPQKIMVTAWYPRTEILDYASDGWPDAVMLPMLYHALTAQPRHCSFVFAEVSGDRDDREFMKELSSSQAPLPLALVQVQTLGLGIPAFAVLPPNLLPDKSRPNAQILLTEAWRIAHLQSIDTERKSIDSPFAPGPTIYVQVVPREPKEVPRIVIYSVPLVTPEMRIGITLPAFHQDYDFIAPFLADIDLKLAPPAETSP
jgi:hypothetical protein